LYFNYAFLLFYLLVETAFSTNLKTSIATKISMDTAGDENFDRSLEVPRVQHQSLPDMITVHPNQSPSFKMGFVMLQV
jgi:hypothetical protein